jgi:hypothetical protein
MRAAHGFAVLLALALATSCGPPFRFVARAPGNPLGAKPPIYVEPLAWDGLKVGEQTEAEYLTGKPPDQVASWQIAKERSAEIYRRELTSGARDLGAQGGYAPIPGGLVVKSHITDLLRGSYLYLPTSVELTVTLTDAKGKVIDQVRTSADVQSDTFSTLATSLRATTQILARRVSIYLHDRAAGN